MRFISPALLAVASFALVAAGSLPKKAIIPRCAPCVQPDCSKAQYPYEITMEEIKLSPTVRTFQADNKMVVPSTDLTASFSDPFDTTFHPSGLISNRLDYEVILTVESGVDGSTKTAQTQTFKINPLTVCSTRLPDGYTTKDVSKVVAFKPHTL
jgi:hypothetical protein